MTALLKASGAEKRLLRGCERLNAGRFSPLFRAEAAEPRRPSVSASEGPNIMGYRVAIVGATGNVGREMLNILEELNFPV
ncbi:MAG: hypothetical protein VXZ43_11975, partial [Pseudomonadota bacterium]|nr:hypothetical protein [Pseudomonadota bacterium]